MAMEAYQLAENKNIITVATFLDTNNCKKCSNLTKKLGKMEDIIA